MEVPLLSVGGVAGPPEGIGAGARVSGPQADQPPGLSREVPGQPSLEAPPTVLFCSGDNWAGRGRALETPDTLALNFRP